MKKLKFHTWSVPRTGLFLMVILLLVSALSGCAPKRVVRGISEPTSSKQPHSELAEELSLPAPSAHGKVLLEKAPDPVKDLQLGLKVATLAKSQMGKQYQWGAQGPEKFDCSGLVYYVYGSLDVTLPRVSRDQAKHGLKIKKSELQPGDLVFFVISGKDINHVGIYVGGSRFIHAPRQYSPVRYDSLNNSWWRQRFKFGRRISG